MTYSQTLAAEIRAEAARKRVTGRELSRYLTENGNGLSAASVARMMRGEKAWDVDSLSLVAARLDVSAVDLMQKAGDAMAESRCTLPSELGSASSQVSALEGVAA